MRLILAISALVFTSPGTAQIVTGSARVVDGDSLEMPGARIRLFGIDAPEGRQTCQRNGSAWQCGREAADQLTSVIGDRPVVCEQQDRDRYGRMVAICSVGDIDLSRAMIQAGMAVALPQFTDAYVVDEARAKSFKLGLWASQFDMPAAYRAANPAIAPASPPPPKQLVVPRQSHAPQWRAPEPYSDGCVIKGNRNRKGQWIYHLPGMPYYEATRPEEVFCTEAQAVAAGYRRAIVK